MLRELLGRIWLEVLRGFGGGSCFAAGMFCQFLLNWSLHPVLIFEARREVSSSLSGIFIAMESGEGKVCSTTDPCSDSDKAQTHLSCDYSLNKHQLFYLHATDELTERTTKDNVLLFLCLILMKLRLEFSLVRWAKTRQGEFRGRGGGGGGGSDMLNIKPCACMCFGANMQHLSEAECWESRESSILAM